MLEERDTLAADAEFKISEMEIKLENLQEEKRKLENALSEQEA